MPIFNTKALDTAVAQALADADVPPDHHNAFALSATASGDVVGVYSRRIGSVWMLDGLLRVDKGQHVDGGVQVKATW